MARLDLSADRLRELLDYNPETGDFRWKVRRSNVAAGAVAGAYKQDRSITIGIDGEIYLAHRLVWLYLYGVWPTGSIDHINGDASDNRRSNLRDVPHLLNMQNRRKPRKGNDSGLIGAAWHERRGHYISRIRDTERRRTVYLGSFATAEEAHAAYVKAKRQMHEGNTL
jgi:hypothetical protein